MNSGVPSVTFVIPCYNHGAFVTDAVRSCLAQEHADTRVVVVDDGSDDGATPARCDACAGERVRVIHQPNRGLSAARNAGAALAATEYLAFLDADDWVEPSFVRRLHEELTFCSGDGSPRASHAYCQERLVELGSGVWKVPAWDPVLLMVTNLHPVTALVRADCFRDAGGFDESMREGYEDWDLWLRFASRGWRGVRVREPLFVWRRHSHATMIHDATARHESLFRRLMSNHAALYAAHGPELLARSNALLRRADANWLDEDGNAIVIRDLRNWARELEGRLHDQQRRAEDASARADAATAETARLRAEYEAKPVVRASRALHRWLDALPGPIAAPFRLAARGARRLLRGSPRPRPDA
ncbi:MAG: glycosyltransferase family 2 protein [Phycisphaerae bacterium]|nr:glycosyltransferase family 2 protein [Phycisphaerae bacterium]